MSIISESVSTQDLRYIYAQNAAGVAAQALSVALNVRGTPVPRQAAHYATYRQPHGYALNTDPGDPGRWNAAAVTQVLTCPEVDPTNGWAAARLKVGSDLVTTLTVT